MGAARPNPQQYAAIAASGVPYRLADLAKDAAAGKARAHAKNARELSWKSKRLGWTLAFFTAQAAATVLSVAYTLRR
jgi:hypothetical protein